MAEKRKVSSSRALLNLNTSVYIQLTQDIAVLQEQVDAGKKGDELQKAINDVVRTKNLLMTKQSAEVPEQARGTVVSTTGLGQLPSGR